MFLILSCGKVLRRSRSQARPWWTSWFFPHSEATVLPAQSGFLTWDSSPGPEAKSTGPGQVALTTEGTEETHSWCAEGVGRAVCWCKVASLQGETLSRVSPPPVDPKHHSVSAAAPELTATPAASEPRAGWSVGLWLQTVKGLASEGVWADSRTSLKEKQSQD